MDPGILNGQEQEGNRTDSEHGILKIHARSIAIAIFQTKWHNIR